MARKHKKFVCLKPLDGADGKKCAVEGIKGVDEKSLGRFARRCSVKGVGIGYGRWKTAEGKKQRGWAVTHHGKQMTQPVAKKQDAVTSMGDYLGKLLAECKTVE